MSMLFKGFLVLFLFQSPVFGSEDAGRGRPYDYLHVHFPPDPVNVRNGNFYLPIQDMVLDCFGPPIELYRSYNSVSSRDGPFGKGWTFNYDVSLNVDESLGLKVVESDGFVNEFTPSETNLGSTIEQIEKIIRAKRKEDRKYIGKEEGKGDEFYNEFQQKLENDPDFFKRQRERYLPMEAKVSKSGKYYSYERGYTQLEKTSNGYVKTSETGRKEEFNSKGLLVRISDRNDNVLNLIYDLKSRLKQVSDRCGQTLRFTYSSTGKIVEALDSWRRKWTFTYDKNHHLIRSAASDGDTISYSYNAKDLMTGIQFSDGVKTTIEYDPKTGYVTEQSGPGKKVTTYTYGKDGGTRWAKISDTEGLKNKYEFIEAEHKTIFTEKAGKKTITTFTPCCGKPLSVKDENGVGEEFVYDKKDNLIAKLDLKKRKTTFEYESRFNLLSSVTSPDGSKLRFVYDNRGNVVYLSLNTGEHLKIVYESHGKIAKMTNQKDLSISLSYNSYGKPTKIVRQAAEGGELSLTIKYGRLGEVERLLPSPNDSSTSEAIQSTLKDFLELLRPAGVEFEI